MAFTRPNDAKWTLVRTRPIVPSKLTIALACPLRYLFETEQLCQAPLPESVPSLMGRAIHAAINAVARGALDPQASSIHQAIKDDFMTLVLKEKMPQAIFDALGVRPSLDALMATGLLVEKMRMALRAIETMPPRVPSISAATHTVKKRATHRSRGAEFPKFGTEISLRSTKLDLSGRADLIDSPKPNVVRISEFKTGSVLTDAEWPKGSYLLQVGAYALVLAEQWPTDAIRIRFVAADAEWEHDLTPQLADRVDATLSEIRNRMPLGRALTAIELAKPGPICITCRFRPICQKYRSWADANRPLRNVTLPMDAWGDVQEIENSPNNNFSSVRIRVTEGIRIRVAAIPSKMLLTIERGSPFAAYGLVSSERGRGQAFPRNLHIVDLRRLHLSAFGAMIC